VFHNPTRSWASDCHSIGSHHTHRLVLCRWSRASGSNVPIKNALDLTGIISSMAPAADEVAGIAWKRSGTVLRAVSAYVVASSRPFAVLESILLVNLVCGPERCYRWML
jgi:hypothetical protein